MLASLARTAPVHSGWHNSIRPALIASTRSKMGGPQPLHMYNGYTTGWALSRLKIGLLAGAGAIYSCAWTPLIGVASLIPFGVFCYAAAECAFAYLAGRKRTKLATQLPKPPMCRNLAWQAFDGVWAGLNEVGNMDARDWLRGWFHHSPPLQDIHRDNVADLLSQAIWCSTREEVHAAGHAADLEAMINTVETRCQIPRLPGHSASCSACDTLRAHSLAFSDTASSDTESSTSYDDLERGSTASKSLLRSISGAAAADRVSMEASPTNQYMADEKVQLNDCDATLTTSNIQPCYGIDSGNFRFAPGYNNQVSTYQPRPDPLPHMYRPLVVYLAFEFMAWMNHNMLLWGGFKHYAMDGVEYYTFNMPHLKKHADGSTGQPASPEKPPFLVLHGVGMGLMPYLKLLITLASTGAPVIGVEYKHVGQRWCKTVPSIEEIRDACVIIAERHGCMPTATGDGGVHVIGHSFGTIVASSLVQTHPKLVRTLSLLDPVCFHMWIPSLLKNFIYRPLSILQPSAKPVLHSHQPKQQFTTTADATYIPVDDPAAKRKGKTPRKSSMLSFLPTIQLPDMAKLMKDLLIMGPAREMHCTAALCRLLDWRTTILRPPSLPPKGKCIIALAENDELLPAPLIADWAKAYTDADVHLLPSLRHADVLVMGNALDPLTARIYDMAYGTQK